MRGFQRLGDLATYAQGVLDGRPAFARQSLLQRLA